MKTIYLTPPLFSECHVKEKIICIRGHRERMFNVSYEQKNEKIIFHNYGQGGAGWTFLFGCVNESIRLFKEKLTAHTHLASQRIAVIGAGCYGLATAIELKLIGHEVVIIADQFEDLPSHKAAGFFFPRPRKVSTPQETAIFERFGKESYRTYLSIARGTHPYLSHGASLLPAFYHPSIDPGFAPYSNEQLLEQPEKIYVDFGTRRHEMIRYQTIFMNAKQLMSQLEAVSNRLGIKRIARHINSFDDLDASVIMNCTGLGAKQLTGDPKLHPIQGHLITLQDQPDVSALQYMINMKVNMMTVRGYMRDELLYFAPKESGILGITFLRGQDELDTNAHEFERILERCSLFFG